MSKGLSDASKVLFEKLLAAARKTTAPYLASDYLSQCEGMIAIAAIERLITLDEQAAYWADINEIRQARAVERKKLEETVA